VVFDQPPTLISPRPIKKVSAIFEIGSLLQISVIFILLAPAAKSHSQQCQSQAQRFGAVD
jgi:hypothetical protein